ncbi:hypothetical protein [Pleurocapsa sp. PCC 7319]|uniref:hypothetical protein n=1 Tax=Pleurocapsa sp. PCC 7319 TaxID=118161 RepID=UPI000344A3F1|nr:hypothetical protein [Pleurocapsa sp. PCC 7319]
MTQLAPDQMAYLKAATKAIAQELKFVPEDEADFEAFFNDNIKLIVEKAKELNFQTWIKFLESKYQHHDYTNAHDLLLETITERLWIQLNS